MKLSLFAHSFRGSWSYVYSWVLLRASGWLAPLWQECVQKRDKERPGEQGSLLYNNPLTGASEGWGPGKVPQFLLRVWAEPSTTLPYPSTAMSDMLRTKWSSTRTNPIRTTATIKHMGADHSPVSLANLWICWCLNFFISVTGGIMGDFLLEWMRRDGMFAPEPATE